MEPPINGPCERIVALRAPCTSFRKAHLLEVPSPAIVDTFFPLMTANGSISARNCAKIKQQPGFFFDFLPMGKKRTFLLSLNLFFLSSPGETGKKGLHACRRNRNQPE